MLDFKYKVFLAVGERLSFSQAAKELKLTQPAVTFQIRHLEDELKTRLFLRISNRIELTPAGKLLLDELRTITNRVRITEKKLMELIGRLWGSVVIGASSTIGNFFLPPVMAKFKRAHPEVDVKVVIDNTNAILGLLADGALDFAIVEGPVPNRRLKVESVFTDELTVLVPADHPLTRSKRITSADIAREPFVTREKGSGTRAVIDSLKIRGKRLIPAENVVMEFGSSAAIVRAVEAGMGISILSRLTVSNELALGTIAQLPIADYPMTRPISLVFTKSVELAKPALELVALCKAHALKIGVGGPRRLASYQSRRK